MRMNIVTQANIVRDVGGHLCAPELPSKEDWDAMLAKYAPGCGSPTHVSGTNGGLMPCGGRLTDLKGVTAQYFCASCQDQMAVV